MNREAQSVLWLVAIIGLALFVVLSWTCIIYDAIQESNVDQVIQGTHHEED
jgi:hypothetical protein